MGTDECKLEGIELLLSLGSFVSPHSSIKGISG